MEKDCPDLGVAYEDVKQIAKKEKDEGFVRIENIDYHGIDPDDETISPLEEITLQRIQSSVKSLMDNGVNPNDITILIRTNKEVPLISEYFNSHPEVVDVKVVSDDAFRLDASPAINIIICALRVLAEPDNPLHLATLTHLMKSVPETFNEQVRTEMRFKPIPEQVEEIYQLFQLHQLPHQDAYLFYFNDIVEQFCEETGLTKTKAVEKILSQYFTDYFRRSPKDRNLFS